MLDEGGTGSDPSPVLMPRDAAQQTQHQIVALSFLDGFLVIL